MMPRVVIDTNLLLSGTVYKGLPKQLVDLVLIRQARLVISPILIDEFREKLTGRFRKPVDEAAVLLADLLEDAFEVSPLESIAVCRDPDDNRILECAVCGNADYIITGDKDLLVLGAFRGIPILTARQFLDQHLYQLS